MRIEEKLGGEDVRLLSLQGKGDDAFGHHFISFICTIPAAGKYRVSLVAAEGPEQGAAQLFHDESALGAPADFQAKERRLSDAKPLGEIQLEEGANDLLIKIVEKPDSAEKYRLDLREIICERVD